MSNPYLVRVAMLELFADHKRSREFRFADHTLKFPVPISRELAGKAEAVCGDFPAPMPRNRAKMDKFPVFSLMIRESGRREGFDPDCAIRHTVFAFRDSPPKSLKIAAFRANLHLSRHQRRVFSSHAVRI